MEEEIRRLTKRRNNESDSDDEKAKKKAKGPSLLSQELSKYAAGRGRHAKGKKKDETDIMTAMSSFRGKLKNMGLDPEDDEEPMDVDKTEGEKPAEEGK
jgi:peptidyl-prolyl cis-trans isomerase SDCCAG10